MQKVVVMSQKEHKKYVTYTRIGKINTFIAYCTLFFTVILLILIGLLIQDSPSWSGKYAAGIDLVVIKGYPEPGYMLQVAKHEIGHHVYFVNINDTKRDEWKILVAKSESRKDYVTEYAMTNEEEDFAETFLSVLQIPSTCDQLRLIEYESLPVVVEKQLFVCDVIREVDMTLNW